MQVQIHITAEKIVATPIGYDKRIKAQFANFGGAQKPFKWDGEAWVIEGESRVKYWADRVKNMFYGWNPSPATITDFR